VETAYEPNAATNWRGTLKQIGFLALTPSEIEASAQFEHIGPVSIEEIGDCAPADVAEEAQGAPNSLRFDTTAVAEREESGMILQHVIGNNYGAAGWGARKEDAVSCVDWHDALQSAVLLGGLQGGGADARYGYEPIVQHKYITVFHVCRYSAAAGHKIRPDSRATE
jgi:hypothetical protein